MARMHYHYAASKNQPGASAANGHILNEPVLWKCLLLIALTYLVWSEKLSIVLDLSPGQPANSAMMPVRQNVKASFLPEFETRPAATSPPASTPQPERKKSQVALPPGSDSHITFAVDPGFAGRNHVSADKVSGSMQKCQEYIARFSPVAVAEMQKYGIPASIILAQGLLESNAGASTLAKATNNHFGIKCFSNKCKNGHCANFSDDSHKDFFVRYGNVWSSYRAHSVLLKDSKRYAGLFRLNQSDYQGWAKGLAKAGYATDKQYADKLIALIENLELYTYDQP
ncbi:MAG: hypothetical protein EP344_19005 [Bacteroidetes bacterium]|nr:MAG: hypothetical protein EP344_19005 [Bacteroidota bacterium]